jgi:hypothetical protein
MPAFSESCRDSGHGFRLFFPKRLLDSSPLLRRERRHLFVEVLLYRHRQLFVGGRQLFTCRRKSFATFFRLREQIWHPFRFSLDSFATAEVARAEGADE